MMATYYPSSKNTHNLQYIDFFNFKIQSIFQFLKISRVLYHMKIGCNVHDIKNKVVVYDTKKKNLKQLAYFGMIQNYDKFSR